ncbi:MAG: hypothetical protein ABFS35_12820 [Bacteroidota bacterium]
MNKLIILFALLILFSCNKAKIPVYAWVSGPNSATDKELKDQFKDYKKNGIDVLMYSGGHNPEIYKRVGRIAKTEGLGFHAWIPSLIQNDNPKLDSSLYAINGLGESALIKPAYVNYYKFLCPNRDEVYDFLSELYGRVANIPEVDGIHLDYIRFPDVILARGLWNKYGLVMDKEYPQFDYCYCDTCVSDFKEQTGIDIKAVEDPSQLEEWKQFRYDLITNLVNNLAKMVHSKNKQITAAVFPGPNSVAKKIVRQEWDKWNIDAFLPMNYNDFYLEDTKWIGEMCRESVSVIDSGKQVYSGLFICPDPENRASAPDPEAHGLLPEELEAAIRESMENGATGICLFTPGRMTKAHWKVFEKAIYKDYSKK